MIKKYCLILLFITATSSTVAAAEIYGGIGYSYGVVTAESDFWNGADSSAPAGTLGIKFGLLSVELAFRPYKFENIHTTSSGTFDIIITEKMLTLGLRYDSNNFSHLNFGIVNHNVEVDYTTSSSSRLLSSAIAGQSVSVYIGGGLHGILFMSDLRWSIDVNYLHRSMEYGVFSFDTGIFYSFYTF